MTGDPCAKDKNGDTNCLKRLRQDLETESTDSMMLLNNLEENPICSVTCDERFSCTFVVWKQYATQTQLRFIHESILLLMKKHRINKILGDDTALPMIYGEDQNWIIEDWMPRALAAGLKAVANKKPTAHWGNVAVSGVQSRLPGSLTWRSFNDLDEARSWLQNASLS